jgi:hypothetical protein
MAKVGPHAAVRLAAGETERTAQTANAASGRSLTIRRPYSVGTVYVKRIAVG